MRSRHAPSASAARGALRTRTDSQSLGLPGGDELRLLAQMHISNRRLRDGKPNLRNEQLVAEVAGEHGREPVPYMRDSGSDFDQQYADRIFGLFKRVHGGGLPVPGLRFAACKRIVGRQDGRIWAASEPDTGAVFSFALPLHAEPTHSYSAG
jgi:light-regulated signal transduction histidine kinase (bacteriophytochrome)